MSSNFQIGDKVKYKGSLYLNGILEFQPLFTIRDIYKEDGKEFAILKEVSWFIPWTNNLTLVKRKAVKPFGIVDFCNKQYKKEEDMNRRI
jgi:hypothetical protein